MRYYFGFLITVGLLIVIIILLFNGNNKKNVPSTSQPLTSYANTGSEVRMTIDGPVNADQNHQQVQVTINQSTVTFDQLQGYDGDVVNQQEYVNTETAYDVFLHAINLAGFTDGNTSSALSDERGYCALGDRYIFELIEGGNDLERLWATNCNGAAHSFDGDLPLTLDLFKAQVPNYQTLVANVQL
jgi:hypothetical protein